MTTILHSTLANTLPHLLKRLKKERGGILLSNGCWFRFPPIIPHTAGGGKGFTNQKVSTPEITGNTHTQHPLLRLYFLVI